MNALERIIRRHIALSGPISLHDYMALCLSHPEHGYYITRDPFGAAGDFTTAPEISQMFGELLGLSLAQSWMDQGAPDRFILAELGPGRGRLMADVLRATSAVPGFAKAANVALVETSPALRREQAKLIPHATWYSAPEDLPEGPLFLLANEFFDALPIRQFHYVDGAWFEKVIGIDQDSLSFGLRRSGLPLGEAPEGAIREQCPQAVTMIAGIAARIEAAGGAVIIVDYGYEKAPAIGCDTFQAVKAHRYADPLADPGTADLTAHVDFAALENAATTASDGVAASAVMTQGDLLTSLGIGARAAALAQTGDGAQIEADLRRLTNPDQMGTLFKAMAFYPAMAPVPAGFAAR